VNPVDPRTATGAASFLLLCQQSSSVECQGPTSPVTLLSVTNNTSNLGLSWAAADYAVSYDVEMAVDNAGTPETFSLAATTSATTYLHMAAPATLTVWYRVRMRNIAGHAGPYSNLLSAQKTGTTLYINDFSSGMDGWTANAGAILNRVGAGTCSGTGTVPSGNVLEISGSPAGAYAAKVFGGSSHPTFISYSHCRADGNTSGYMDFNETSLAASFISHHTPRDVTPYQDGWTEPGNFWSILSQTYNTTTWILTEYKNINWTTKTMDIYSSGVLVKKGASFAAPAAVDFGRVTMSEAYSGRTSYMGGMTILE